MPSRLRSPYRPARTQAPDTDVARDPSAGRPRATWRRIGSRGVTGRLVVAVLLPITVLGVGAGALLKQRYETAQQAASIGRSIPTLNQLSNLRQLLDQERIPVEGWLRAKQFGFDIPNISSFLGFTNESMGQARAATNGELRALGTAAPPGSRPRWPSCAAGSTRGRSPRPRPTRPTRQLDDLLSSAFAARLGGLQGRIAGLSSSAGLQSSLGSLSERQRRAQRRRRRAG